MSYLCKFKSREISKLPFFCILNPTELYTLSLLGDPKINKSDISIELEITGLNSSHSDFNKEFYILRLLHIELINEQLCDSIINVIEVKDSRILKNRIKDAFAQLCDSQSIRFDIDESGNRRIEDNLGKHKRLEYFITKINDDNKQSKEPKYKKLKT